MKNDLAQRLETILDRTVEANTRLYSRSN